MAAAELGTPIPSWPVTVSVVVPSFRRLDFLKRCVDGLLLQVVRPDEIVVIVQRRDNESLEYAERLPPPVRLVIVDRPGQVAALNAGSAEATGSIIAITDDDAVPRPDWVQNILRRFAETPTIGAVGGRDVVHNHGGVDGGQTKVVGRVRWWGRRIGLHHYESRLQDVDFLKGVNMSFRRDCAPTFDPLLKGVGAQVCNDLEVSWGVRKKGWRVVYDPAVVVDHYPAPRHDADGRNSRSVETHCDAAHNELYALLRHASWWQKAAILVYTLFVGDRGSPGLILGLRNRRSFWISWRLTRARLDALRTLRLATSRDPRSLDGTIGKAE